MIGASVAVLGGGAAERGATKTAVSPRICPSPSRTAASMASNAREQARKPRHLVSVYPVHWFRSSRCAGAVEAGEERGGEFAQRRGPVPARLLWPCCASRSPQMRAGAAADRADTTNRLGRVDCRWAPATPKARMTWLRSGRKAIGTVGASAIGAAFCLSKRAVSSFKYRKLIKGHTVLIDRLPRKRSAPLYIIFMVRP